MSKTSSARTVLSLCLALSLVTACSGGSGGGGSGGGAATGSTTSGSTAGSTTGGASTPAAVLPHGEFLLLTYNVAGLPPGISSSDPAKNTPLISPILNAFQIVLAQEDFFFHPQLAQDARHAHRSLPMTTHQTLANDGLNRFSEFPFVDFTRQRWNDCHGWVNAANDCLSSKGFSMARHQFAPAVFVDVYNLHADAGGSADDERARRGNFEQLKQHILAHSQGNAVIVAGDTNLKQSSPEDEATLVDFMTATQLKDSARELGKPEHIDRILVRSGDTVDLEALEWRVASEFVNSNGDDLSDHPAIEVKIRWAQTR